MANPPLTVLVTGAGSGIGRAVAENFAAQGATVIVHDMVAGAKTFADSIGAHFLQADLNDRQAVNQLAADALALAGGRVDILVNNAGFQHVAKIEAFDEDKWVSMIQVLLTAPFQLSKALIPAMKANQWGRIINICSIHGVVASPYKSAYISAKHGIVGFTKSLALELGEFGITANAICPAYVKTAIVEKQIDDQARNLNLSPEQVVDQVMLAPAAIKRLIEPAEVAAFASYLASDNGAIITGAAHMVDLGWTAR